MPVTRSLTEKLRMESNATENDLAREAGERVFCSVVGSRASLGSSKAALKIAKIRVEELKKKLHLEAEGLRLCHAKQMLKAQTDVQVAAVINSLSQKSEQMSIKPIGCRQKVEEYLESIPHKHATELRTAHLNASPDMERSAAKCTRAAEHAEVCVLTGSCNCARRSEQSVALGVLPVRLSGPDGAKDQRVIDYVINETKLIDAHYVVPLPWKKELSRPITNRSTAVRRLEYLRRRFMRELQFRQRYTAVMDANIAKGYARGAGTSMIDTTVPLWYLPHHAVLNPKKPEKLRVVLDCAAKFHGVSLNDILCQGPGTTADPINVLLRFRIGLIAVSADIKEMFMQVRVPERGMSALRFLWWEDGDIDGNPGDYEMTVHPFGATSSPFCRNYALRRTAIHFGQNYDEFTRSAVCKNFYVDDCLISFDSFVNAKKFVEQCCHMLSRGGFRLKKWVSNDIRVLENIPAPECATPFVNIDSPSDHVHGALGLQWQADTDVYTTRFDVPDKPLSRHGILSAVSSFYNHLGRLSPLCLSPRLLLQRLCKVGLITGCQEDADGLVRTMVLRMSKGTTRRDVRGVCLLEGVD